MSSTISVIIPTYNRASLLRRALDSVVAQTLPPAEVIVIDDGGTDNTPEVIRDVRPAFDEAKIALHFHRQNNSGPAQARNSGLQLARGDRAAFLDSDDLWRPAFLQTMSALLDAHPSAALAFGGMEIIDAADQVWTHRPTGLPASPRVGLLVRPFEQIVAYMPMGTPCVMVRREVATEMGGFDASYRIGEDWDLWYRIALRYDFAFSQEPLTLCREHPRNLPKDDAAAWADRVRLNFHYLPRTSGNVRDILLARHLDELLLYQEQLLREGKRDADGLIARIITARLSPASLRFRMGSMLLQWPRWCGKVFAGAIRGAGHLRRASIKSRVKTRQAPPRIAHDVTQPMVNLR